MSEELNSYRYDKKYLESLLMDIQDETIRKSLANEVFTYAYRAAFYKVATHLIQISLVTLPALTTALGGLSIYKQDVNALPEVFVCIISVLTATLGAIQASIRPREMWVHYRKYAEMAKLEIVQCVSETGDYEQHSDSRIREQKLVENMQKIFTDENQNWQSFRARQNKDSQ